MHVDNCVLCGIGHGREHVFPQWLLDRWRGSGPFTIDHGGRPLKTARGLIRTSAEMWRLMLDVCPTCNGLLNDRFEVKGKPALRAILDHSAGILDHVWTRALARWAAKTVLLSVHPRAVHSSQARELSVDRASAWSPYPQAILGALAVGALPDDLYVWVGVLDPVDGESDPIFEPIELYSTSRVDGLGGTGRSHLLCLSMDDGRLLAVQVAYAPLHELKHPFQSSGLVTQLCPTVSVNFDVEAHAAVGIDTKLGRVFRDWGMGVGLGAGEVLPVRGPAGGTLF